MNLDNYLAEASKWIGEDLLVEEEKVSLDIEAKKLDQIKLSKFLKKETKVKDIYFDSVDLVVGEKTVLANAIALKNNFKVSDLVKAILKATK